MIKPSNTLNHRIIFSLLLLAGFNCFAQEEAMVLPQLFDVPDYQVLEAV